ncbi:MAG: hypothetical protein AB8G86_27285 [Saprospiraceae bacterium]
MKEYTKSIRSELRSLNGLAHGRYLDRALSELQQQFSRWESKEIDGFDLKEIIHQFHNGPARDLYVSFGGSQRMNDSRVANALVEGLIKESEISAATLTAIARSIENARARF